MTVLDILDLDSELRDLLGCPVDVHAADLDRRLADEIEAARM